MQSRQAGSWLGNTGWRRTRAFSCVESFRGPKPQRASLVPENLIMSPTPPARARIVIPHRFSRKIVHQSMVKQQRCNRRRTGMVGEVRPVCASTFLLSGRLRREKRNRTGEGKWSTGRQTKTQTHTYKKREKPTGEHCVSQRTCSCLWVCFCVRLCFCGKGTCGQRRHVSTRATAPPPRGMARKGVRHPLHKTRSQLVGLLLIAPGLSVCCYSLTSFHNAAEGSGFLAMMTVRTITGGH